MPVWGLNVSRPAALCRSARVVAVTVNDENEVATGSINKEQRGDPEELSPCL